MGLKQVHRLSRFNVDDEIEKLTQGNKMKYTLKIKADPNDADYEYQESVITESDLVLVKKWAKLLKEKKLGNGHNWLENEYGNGVHRDVYREHFTDDEIEQLRYYVPCGEYGMHTIDDIEIAPEVNWESLL